MKLIKCFRFIILKRQLSLNKYLLLILLFAGITYNSEAQLLKFDWPEPDFSMPEISPEFLNEDAVILNQIDILSLEPSKSMFNSSELNQRYELITFKKVRLKILTLDGLEKYANFEFSLKNDNKLEILDGRVLKANKTFHYIDTADLVEINSRNSSYGLNSEDLYKKKIKIAFPNVEVGDMIEYVYSYQTSDYIPYDLSNEVVLNDDIPILSSDYIVKVPKDMEILYKTYNNFQKPMASKDDLDMSCSFHQDSIPSLFNSEFSNIQSQLPFFYYQVLPKDIKDFRMNWDFIYKMYYAISFSDKILNPLNKNYYNKWEKNLLKNYKDSTKTAKFSVLFDNIRKNLIVKNVMPEYNMNYSVGYYLKAGYINKLNLLRLYKKIFDDLKMNYYLCFARNKYKDPINFEALRKDESTDFFFIFIDENNRHRFVYPNDEIQKFEIDELPNNLEGTEAVMMKHTIDKSKPFTMGVPEFDKYMRYLFKLKYDLKIETTGITLPSGKTNRNFILQQYSLNINLDDSIANFKNNIKLSGSLSTKYRTFFSMMDKDQDLYQYYSTVTSELYKNSQKDSSYIESYKHTYPFEFKIVSTGEIKNCIQKIDSGLYIISFKDLIFHDILNLPDEERIFNVVPEFVYTDAVQLFIKFDKPIKLVNPNAYNVSVDNEIGSYSFSAKEINSSTIAVISQYSLKADVLPAEKYKNLMELNKACKHSILRKMVVQKL